MPRILCIHPSCKTVVEYEEGNRQTRCEKHAKNNKRKPREIPDHQRLNGGKGSHIYSTQRWRRLSKKKRAVNPFCEDCELDGVMNPCDIVDHVVEIKDGGEPFLWSNLRSLCHAHHNAKTAKERERRKRHGK